MPSQTARVTVYRTRSCPFCIEAAAFLDRLGVAYEEVSLDGHPDRRAVTASILPGHSTVPLILIDGEPIGGYQELVALDAAGALRPKLFGPATR